ncbi:acriflavin resistance protein [Desulfofarcimen acetoxidans DSM 771]|uniref:Acriflavin resistance protein n=1 Tax=Desulfofarcimen acetoxidans (strain ATCC 49208 / DSM 771 / KCTC 5769 / VKM B-1644 / 5575) TaxID=485916 RepID=C8VYH5_DESAS|nr:efflux RND transporter permease subunit [Desulfofarcimen acetoxidans]ACV62856.1 acriflavin resistance protein [Desulfofarcimen acetoxidans DSM 771]
MLESLIRKRKITILFFVMITSLGFISFFQLAKQESPDIIVKTALVTTVYPGARPEKVEQTVTRKIEEQIKEMEDLKSITSTSSLGVSQIIIQAKDDVKDPKAIWDELRKKVKDAEKDLPEDAKQPIINDNLNRTFVQTINLTAPDREHLYSMREMIKNWKDQLRTLPNVSNVTVTGLPEEEVRVIVDSQKLQNYGLSWPTVLNAVKMYNDKNPLGTVEGEKRTYELTLNEVKNVDEFKNVLVSRTSGNIPVYLKDVARVDLTTKRVAEYVFQNGKPAISVSISAETGSDVPSLQKSISKMMSRLVKGIPSWSTAEVIFTQNDRVDELFSDLARETFFAVISVIFVCTLGLNLTTSFVVMMAIPISIALGIIPLNALGISLNQISIVALVIVLGILVDDAVVVNDNIERRLSVLRESPEDAAIKGSKEVSVSILTATLSTICAFGPLAFLQGDVGSFIRPIPVIISLTMLASMAMSLTIIPIFRQWHETKRIKTGLLSDKANSEAADLAAEYRKPAGLLGKQLQSVTSFYAGKLMPRMLKKPLKTGMIGVLIGTLAYGLIPFTPVQLFPNANRAEMLINVRLPVGSSINNTANLVQDLSLWLKGQATVKMVSAYAGVMAPKMFGGDTGSGSGDNIAQLVVTLDKNKLSTEDAVKKWEKELQNRYPNASVIPKELQAGPPVGNPVAVRIYGDDLEKLRNLSKQMQDVTKSVRGTTDIQDSFGIDRYAVSFDLNKENMDAKMVNPNDISRTIRLVSEGISNSQFDNGRDLIDITLFSDTQGVDSLAAIQRLTVPNALGEQVPLYQLAEIHPSFSMPSISHRNLSRVVTVTADVKGRTATDVIKELTPLLNKVKLPEGYQYEIAGETSEQSDIFIDMGKLSVIVFFLIIILITLQFYSLSIPFLVMSTIFLAFAGSLIGLFITRTPLGFMTMMGVISLTGIVVRNGIILVEFIENARHEGMELVEAVISAGESRLRPILLTSATAIAGLMPLAVAGDVLFRPLAVTIMSGLFFSTMLTLIIVPSFYTVLAQIKIRRAQKALV